MLLNNDAGDDNESPYNDSAEHDANQNKDEHEDEANQLYLKFLPERFAFHNSRQNTVFGFT